VNDRLEPKASDSPTAVGRPAPPRSSSGSASVIGATLVIKGELTAEEDLLVRGTIEGKIDHNHTLTVHPDGTLRASVKAREVMIEGTVEGDIYGTERVKICETGSVVGNVYAPRVGVMEGARFKGVVDMESDAASIEQRFYDKAGLARPERASTRAKAEVKETQRDKPSHVSAHKQSTEDQQDGNVPSLITGNE
jgi:cytoskeletal protein CcmA (bactofilin family)